MKKAILLIIQFIFLINLYSQDVYINNTNYIYHTKECKEITKKHYQVQIDEDIIKYYKPCNICNPNNDIILENNEKDLKAPLGYENIPEYNTINGKNIRVGDTLRLGVGSRDNGDFAFIWSINPLLYTGNFGDGKLDLFANYSNRKIIVTQIVIPKKEKNGDVALILFKLNGWIGKIRCEIESAISRKELIIDDYKINVYDNENTKTKNVIDEIYRLKELLEQGLISNEEFNKIKKALLE